MLVVFKAMSRRIGAMGDDDVLFRFRLRLFSLAEELGNVRAACRLMGVHPSTYYHWKARVEQSGLEMLRPRERRAPRMPNQLSSVIETRILAFSIAHPGLGPRRISASLAQDRWGGISVSPSGVWKVLRRHGLSRRISRLSLVAGYAAPPEIGRPPEPERHIEVSEPGELVGFDCFHVGRLSGTKGRGLAVHRHRHGHELHLGRAAHDPAEPECQEHEPPRATGGRRSGRTGLAPPTGAHR